MPQPLDIPRETTLALCARMPESCCAQSATSLQHTRSMRIAVLRVSVGSSDCLGGTLIFASSSYYSDSLYPARPTNRNHIKTYTLLQPDRPGRRVLVIHKNMSKKNPSCHL